MSRIGNRRKAVDLAWKRERELVLEGKGTRDWTEEQQRQIVEEGRATDESGRAFDGHHMKNVAAYPDYQEDPDNIQFLSRSEHLEAHGGCTQNSTNGFYDYKTGETHDFGDNPPTPCEVIELSNPIYLPTTPKNEEVLKAESEPKVRQKDKGAKTDTKTQIQSNNTNKSQKQYQKAPEKTKSFFEKASDIGKRVTKTVADTGGKVAKAALKFAADHPVLTTLGIAAVTYVTKETIGGGNSSNGSSHTSSSSRVNISRDDYENYYEDDYGLEDDIYESNESDDYVERKSPVENDVPAHRQRYHTKEGTKWKDKEPYHRGGKTEE